MNCQGCKLFIGIGKDNIAGTCLLKDGKAFSSAFFEEYPKDCGGYQD